MTRKLIYQCSCAEHFPLASLDDEGCELVSFANFDDLLEHVVHRRPDVLICGLRPSCPQDLAILQLLRRVAPRIPLIVLATEGSLAAQRQVQGLQLVYYAVCPVDESELRGAVHAAVALADRSVDF